MSIGRFSAGVFVLLRSPAGKYLVLKRSPEKDFAAGGWECVTGRVDQGEGFPQAVHREISRRLQNHPELVTRIGERTSRDIFGQKSSASVWCKVDQ